MLQRLIVIRNKILLVGLLLGAVIATSHLLLTTIFYSPKSTLIVEYMSAIPAACAWFLAPYFGGERLLMTWFILCVFLQWFLPFVLFYWWLSKKSEVYTSKGISGSTKGLSE
jgi:hypothetical protein